MALAAIILGLEWTRPWGLVAFMLPLLVLWLARARPRSTPIATGTLALWGDGAASNAPTAVRARAPIDPSLWLFALSLCVGALALAGPSPVHAAESRTWRVVVDRSPSMYRADAQADAPIVTASRVVETWLARALSDGDNVAWVSPNGTRSEEIFGATLPTAWRSAPGIARVRPTFESEDRDGTLWVTRAPLANAPRAAGVSVAATRPSTGPIAIEGTTRFDWDGATVREITGGATASRVLVHGRLPAPIDALVDAWAQARGRIVERGAAREVARSADVALEIRVPSAEIERPADAGRDGWRASGRARGEARERDADGDLEHWLDAPDGRALVTRAPGRIECAWSQMERPSGDPAAFVVSWSELLDACVLPPPDVVPLAERLTNEDARFEPPRAPPPRPTDATRAARTAAPSIAAWLSLAAFALALVAWWIAPARSRLAPPCAIGYTSPRGSLRAEA